MTSKDPKGGYNRALIINGDNYDYCKEYISVHIQPVDMNVWDAFVNGWFKLQIYICWQCHAKQA